MWVLRVTAQVDTPSFGFNTSCRQPFHLPITHMADPVIPKLPREIIQIILNYLPGKALKNFRLCSKTLAILVEPRLFERMVLVPYIDCLEGFANLMCGNKIAQHVRLIHYDAESRWYPRAGGLPAITIYTQYPYRRKQLWEKISTTILTRSDASTEVALLSNCFRQLPSFRTLHVQEASREPFSIFDSANFQPVSDRSLYFARLESQFGPLKQWPCTRYIFGQGSAIALLACLASSSIIEELAVHNLEADARAFELQFADVFGRAEHRHMFQSVLHKVRRMKVCFSRQSLEEQHHWEGSITRRSLGYGLGSAPELEHLTIEYTSKVPSRPANLDDSWLSSLKAVLFPRLKSLTLDKIVCWEPELLRLIRNHRKTLKSLCLADVMFVGMEDDSTFLFPASLTTAIRECNIPRVELIGTGTNSDTDPPRS